MPGLGGWQVSMGVGQNRRTGGSVGLQRGRWGQCDSDFGQNLRAVCWGLCLVLGARAVRKCTGCWIRWRILVGSVLLSHLGGFQWGSDRACRCLLSQLGPCGWGSAGGSSAARWSRRRQGISWGGFIGWGRAGRMCKGRGSQAVMGVPVLSDAVCFMCRQQGKAALREQGALGGLCSKRARESGGACVLCGVRACAWLPVFACVYLCLCVIVCDGTNPAH